MKRSLLFALIVLAAASGCRTLEQMGILPKGTSRVAGAAKEDVADLRSHSGGPSGGGASGGPAGSDGRRFAADEVLVCWNPENSHAHWELVKVLQREGSDVQVLDDGDPKWARAEQVLAPAPVGAVSVGSEVLAPWGSGSYYRAIVTEAWRGTLKVTYRDGNVRDVAQDDCLGWR